MVTQIKGGFRKGDYIAPIPKGISPSLKIGDKVDPEILDTITKEQEARIKLHISDPSGIRPFIDQPAITGDFPTSPDAMKVALSRIINDYRMANGNVIHAAGFITKDFQGSDNVSYLTDIYFQCADAFNAMKQQLIDNDILPMSEGLRMLQWENIAFPRLADNLHLLRAVTIFIEQEDADLVTNVLLLYMRNGASVYSTRLKI